MTFDRLAFASRSRRGHGMVFVMMMMTRCGFCRYLIWCCLLLLVLVAPVSAAAGGGDDGDVDGGGGDGDDDGYALDSVGDEDEEGDDVSGE